MFQVKISYTPITYIGTDKFEYEQVEKIIDLDTNVGIEAFLDALDETVGFLEHPTRICKGHLTLPDDEEFELKMLKNAIDRAIERDNIHVKFNKVFITIINYEQKGEETMLESFAKELKEDLKSDLKIFKSFKKKDWLTALGILAMVAISIIAVIEAILIWG